MKIRKKSLSEFTLLALEKAIDGSIRINHLLNNPSFYAYKGGWDYQLKKSELAQAIKRLREKGLIEYEGDKTNQIIMKLTSLGKDALGHLSILLEENWDGKFRLVIFDIPEQKRTVRNLLRRRLKDWGFKNWQKSVWVGRHDVTDKLRQLIKNLGIKDWVAVVESSDPTLDSLFGRSSH